MRPHALKLACAVALMLPVTQAAAPYCLSGESCFPDDATLSTFNATVYGALIKAVPYGAACYKATYDADECKRLAKIKGDSDYRLKLPAGVMYTNFEQISGIGCPVPDPTEDGSAPAAIDSECTLGNMPSYVVNATNTNQIMTSVRFAAKYNLRLRIKNSGHDYSGRSSGAGSLSIWTRHLTSIENITSFVPDGCKNTDGDDVVSAGSGVNVEEIYNWGAANGKVTIGGYANTVGVAGGYILSGGLGALVPIFGMGVDNLLQVELVTADAKVKIANKCQNSDLFWALRGGGGKCFGVTTRIWLKAHPALAAVNTVTGQVGCKDFESYSRLIDMLVNDAVRRRNDGHFGVWEANGAQLGVALVTIVPYQNQTDVKTPDQTLAEVQSTVGIQGCTPAIEAAQFTGPASWNDAYRRVVSPIAEPAFRLGINLQDQSRIVSYDAIHHKDTKQLITDAILALPADVPFIWQNNCGNEVTNIAGDATSVHPDWRNAFAFVDVPVSGPWSGTTATQNATSADAGRNLTSAFGAAQYYNEQYESTNWQQDFFGSNYARLLKIKDIIMPLENNNDKGVTGAAKFVTSTLGNAVGGVGRTAGNITGAAGRGLGDTITSATGSTGKPVGDAIGSVGSGIQNGADGVSKGVENAGQWKSS
ncbi:FAD-binding domain-containing protein [Astrocystis sublimbata]|nr:FAD-binding domain-containing protein [Astrocystis sublimbata]